MNNELYHHGIKGQKWGVRHYQNPDGSLTELGRKRYHKNDGSISGTDRERLKAAIESRKAKDSFAGYDRNKDLVIKKGTPLYRAQLGNRAGASEQIYTTLSKKDHLDYLETAAAGEGLMLAASYSSDDTTPYSVVLKLDKDIVAPSYQATMNAFVDTFSNTSVKELYEQAPYSNKSKAKEKTDEFLKSLGNMTSQEATENAYKLFSETWMSDTKARRMFFDTLKKQGYTAIIDENDHNFGKGFAEAPLIVFDKSDTKIASKDRVDEEVWDMFSDLYWGGYDEQDLEVLAKRQDLPGHQKALKTLEFRKKFE